MFASWGREAGVGDPDVWKLYSRVHHRQTKDGEPCRSVGPLADTKKLQISGNQRTCIPFVLRSMHFELNKKIDSFENKWLRNIRATFHIR